jgi:hypothetical protein
MQFMQVRRVRVCGSPGLLDELSQCHRSATWLSCEPFPMARQQCDLPRNDPNLGTPRSAAVFISRRLEMRHYPSRNVFVGPAQVEINLLASRFIEDED